MNGKSEIRISDALGRVLIESSFELIEGYNQTEVNLSDLPDGQYFYTVNQEGFILTQGKIQVVE